MWIPKNIILILVLSNFFFFENLLNLLIRKTVISTTFILKNNKLSLYKFCKKGTYSLPAIILDIASSHEYYVKFLYDNKE